MALARGTRIGAAANAGEQRVEMLFERTNGLLYATVRAMEEALNAMFAAKTMTGADGLHVHALPRDRLLAARKSGRLK